MKIFEGLTRRRFMNAVAIATGGLVFGSACSTEEEQLESHATPPGPSGDLLARALRSHFSYLDFDDDVIAAFANDLTAHQGAWHPRKSAPPFTRFLASTDFFQNGGDENRTLEYVRYYDPYVSPCYSPFAPQEAKR